MWILGPISNTLSITHSRLSMQSNLFNALLLRKATFTNQLIAKHFLKNLQQWGYTLFETLSEEK